MRTTTFWGRTALVDRPQAANALVRIEMRVYQYSLVVLDLILVYLAFRAAFFLRFFSGLGFYQNSIIPKVPFYSNMMLYSIPLWVGIFAFMGLYRQQYLLGGTREYSLVFNATTLGMFLIISAGFLFPEELILARGWVVLAWLFAFLFVAGGRFACRRLIYSLRTQGHFQMPAVIIGANEEGLLLAEQFLTNQTSGIRMVGYVDEHQVESLRGKLPWLGKLPDLDQIIERYGVNEVILTSSALSQEQILGMFRKYGTVKDLTLRLSSGLYEIITTGMQVKEVGLVPLVTMNKVRMTGVDQFFKTLLDYCIAVPVVILLLPLFGLLALAVRLDSPGSIIYRRRVMGVNGKQFDAFKFRTMRTDGDALLAANPELMKEYLQNFKIKEDPRVTRLGKFLRKTSLDELPQLFNVLRNEMSLIGPRMICPQELEKYNQWDINLLTVKPGITGLWQVRGRSDVSYEERVRMDMYYIRNWTIWMDLHLLFQTVPAVLARRGAY